MTPAPRAPWRRRRPKRAKGQGGKFHSRYAFYFDGRVHVMCPPTVADACDVCSPKRHPRCRRKQERLHCALCAAHERWAAHWYDSAVEARTASRLDEMLGRGEIVAWRRAHRVVLTPAIPGQLAITYTPDFVVTFKGHVPRVWEVKGSAFVIADDARLKIKLYRVAAATHGWPPLDVVDAKGRVLEV